jgi:O-antigen ligase
MVISRGKLYEIAEYLFVILALLLISDALTPLLYPPGRDALELGESNPARLYCAMIVYAISLVLLFPKLRTAGHLLARRPELTALVVLSMLSVLWSGDLGPVFRRAVAHTLTIVFCLYLATRYNAHEFLSRLLVALCIGTCASVIVCLVMPSIGVTSGAINHGAWFGVYGHKAVAGRVCAIAIFVALLYKPTTPVMGWVKLAALVSTAILCVMTQSRASWLLVIWGAASALAVRFLRTDRLSVSLRIMIVVTLVALFVTVGALTFNELMLAFGRDATLSGRTSLWSAAIHVAGEENPWFGSGYRAFWLGPDVDKIRVYLTGWARMPAHAHNGYLDTWLELGWVGLSLLVVFMLRTVGALTTTALRDTRGYVWPVFMVCAFVFIVNNMSATVALRHTDAAWVLFVLASLYTADFERRFDHAKRQQIARSRAVRRGPVNERPPGATVPARR